MCNLMSCSFTIGKLPSLGIPSFCSSTPGGHSYGNVLKANQKVVSKHISNNISFAMYTIHSTIQMPRPRIHKMWNYKHYFLLCSLRFTLCCSKRNVEIGLQMTSSLPCLHSANFSFLALPSLPLTCFQHVTTLCQCIVSFTPQTVGHFSCAQ